MLKDWLVGVVVSFALRQLKKFATAINWDTVLADAVARIKDLVPGTFFDDEAATFVTVLIGGIKTVLSDQTAWGNILTLLSSERWSEALVAIKDLLLSVWAQLPAPTIPEEAAAKAKVVELVTNWHPAGAAAA